MGFPCGSVVKSLPTNAGDAGSIPGSGRSLEKEMATHSSVLAWRIPWTEESGGLQSMGSQRDMTELATLTPRCTHMHLYICMFISILITKMEQAQGSLIIGKTIPSSSDIGYNFCLYSSCPLAYIYHAGLLLHISI